MRAGTARLCSTEEGAGMEGLTRGCEEVPAAPGALETLQLPSHSRAGGKYRFTAGEHVNVKKGEHVKVKTSVELGVRFSCLSPQTVA